MKFAEYVSLLNKALEQHPQHADDTVVIRCANPSMGSTSAVGVEGVAFGFDWDRGRTFLTLADAAEVLHLPARDPVSHVPRFEDVEVAGILFNNTTGCSCILQHRSGFVGGKLRIDPQPGDRLRIIKLRSAKPAAVPETSKQG